MLYVANIKEMFSVFKVKKIYSQGLNLHYSDQMVYIEKN
jgi:hypothetical protein